MAAYRTVFRVLLLFTFRGINRHNDLFTTAVADVCAVMLHIQCLASNFIFDGLRSTTAGTSPASFYTAMEQGFVAMWYPVALGHEPDFQHVRPILKSDPDFSAILPYVGA